MSLKNSKLFAMAVAAVAAAAFSYSSCRVYSEVQANKKLLFETNYAIYDKNAYISSAKVFLYGESHLLYEKEISLLLKHYVKDGDVILFEGMAVRQDYSFLLGKSRSIDDIEKELGKNAGIEDRINAYAKYTPKLYEIKDKNVKILGMESRVARSMALEYGWACGKLEEKIKSGKASKEDEENLAKLSKKRDEWARILDECFYDYIRIVLGENPGAGVHVIDLGRKHVAPIAAGLKKFKINFVAFVPLTDKATPEFAKEYEEAADKMMGFDEKTMEELLKAEK